MDSSSSYTLIAPTSSTPPSAAALAALAAGRKGSFPGRSIGKASQVTVLGETNFYNQS